MLPSEFPEVAGYPAFQELLARRVDMQVNDVRALLRLPIPAAEFRDSEGRPLAGLDAGCNLLATTAIFNLVAGASVCFFEASPRSISDRRDRGRRFKEVLERFFPWAGEPASAAEGARMLYDLARNPLAHSLGLEPASEEERDEPDLDIAINKWALRPEQIALLEDSPRRPPWTYGVLTVNAVTGQRLSISVPALYWGFHRMLHALFADADQVRRANELAS